MLFEVRHCMTFEPQGSFSHLTCVKKFLAQSALQVPDAYRWFEEMTNCLWKAEFPTLSDHQFNISSSLMVGSVQVILRVRLSDKRNRIFRKFSPNFRYFQRKDIYDIL